MKREAFTIWELLAVVATIVVLYALLRPVFQSVRAGEYHGSCLTNEERLARAIFLYAQDSDNALPDVSSAPGGNVTWRRAISHDIHNPDAYLCPARHDTSPGPDGFFRSYAANYNGDYSDGKNDKGNGAFAGPGSKPVRLKDIPHPNQLIMLCEFAGGNTPEFNIDDPVRFGPEKKLLWAAHAGRSDCLFADGHVDALKPPRTKDLWHRDASVPLSANGVAVLAETQSRAGE